MTIPTYEQISNLNQDQRRRYAESCKSAWKVYEETAIGFYTELCKEPAPATVESLKAEVERLTKERDDLRAYVATLNTVSDDSIEAALNVPLDGGESLGCYRIGSVIGCSQMRAALLAARKGKA